MKGVIVYKGKYGATRQYAQWISDELGFPVIESNNIEKETLNLYDVVVIGTSVYTGKLQISGWLKKNFPFICNKKIFLYQVAGVPPSQINKREDFNRKSLPHEILERCKAYYLPGRLIVKKLSWMDRFILKMGSRMTKDPAEKKRMLTDYNLVNKENLKNMINEISAFIAPGYIPGDQAISRSVSSCAV